ncbi:MAG TPA: tetratricopeptide repeat protein [Polyangiales bacterium]|nr:tetratricopeptide repeat protein [Polyangiales bacterium]
MRAVALSCMLWPAIALAEPPAAKSPPPRADPPTKPAQPSNEARECFRKAQAAYVAGDLQTALAGFQCAYKAAPSPELHFNLARVYERMGEADDSIQHYEAYLAESPVTPKERKQIEARLKSLAELRERQRAPAEQAKPTAEALSAEARVLYDRGVKLYRAAQYEAALAAFSAALQMSSAPELHFNLAVVSERLGRSHDAVNHYRAYLAARGDADDRDQVQARIAALSPER